MLKKVERVSAGFTDRVIIANHLWLDKYATRTGANGKCSVFINNVDARIFRLRPRSGDRSKCIILFPGGLQWHQGLDIAIRAFAKVLADFENSALRTPPRDTRHAPLSPSALLDTRPSTLPQLEFHIYGDGNMKESLIALAKELGLEGK